jgi:triosephosphate isomerase
VRKIAINIARLLLALTLILSGFVKAVDPLGTQYKISDYLGAMHLSPYVPDLLTLSASVVLSAVEFVLGICLLFAIRRRLVTRLTLAIMIIMVLLTLWLALANPISDCGCFGDAVVLTNWQTFWKNVVLLAVAVLVSRWPLEMPRMIGRSNQWIVFNYAVLFILFISGYSLYDLPMFDFRPYHIGANIKEGMTVPEGAQLPQFETTFILEKDGQRQEFTAENYPDSTWTFIDSKTVQTAKGYVPPIHDFSIISDEGEDITDEVLTHEGYTFLLVSPHLEYADDSQLDRINQIYEYSLANGYTFYCLTASTEQAISRWQDITGAEYPFCSTDETTLKTIIRSNPGLLLLKKGTIIRKWSHNSLPDEAQFEKPLEKSTLGQMPIDSVPSKIAWLLAWFVLPLAALTIADRLWAWTKWIRKREKGEGRSEK